MLGRKIQDCRIYNPILATVVLNCTRTVKSDVLCSAGKEIISVTHYACHDWEQGLRRTLFQYLKKYFGFYWRIPKLTPLKRDYYSFLVWGFSIIYSFNYQFSNNWLFLLSHLLFLSYEEIMNMLVPSTWLLWMNRLLKYGLLCCFSSKSCNGEDTRSFCMVPKQ